MMLLPNIATCKEKSPNQGKDGNERNETIEYACVMPKGTGINSDTIGNSWRYELIKLYYIELKEFGKDSLSTMNNVMAHRFNVLIECIMLVYLDRERER